MNHRTKKILDNGYRFLTSRPVYHALFWVVLASAMLFLDEAEGRFQPRALANLTVLLTFFAAIVYANVLFFIPQFLAKSRVLAFFGLLFLTVLLLTPLEMIALYWLSSLGEDPEKHRASLVASQKVFFLMNGVMAVFSSVLKIITDWFRSNVERERLRTETMQSELRFLRSQINPHFLFNTLNNLYALTLKKDQKAPETVLKLSEIMRYMLYECNEKRVPLAREIQYIQNYLDLEKLRLTKNMEVSFEVDGHVSDQKIAPLLFIPFVENAFKHGLNNQISSGFCRIRLQVKAEQLEFFIENSRSPRGPALDRGRPKSGGIGLSNVRQRLKMLYPNAHELHFDEKPDSYAVYFYLWLDAEKDPSPAFLKAAKAPIQPENLELSKLF